MCIYPFENSMDLHLQGVTSLTNLQSCNCCEISVQNNNNPLIAYTWI
jgi:hypothetical protein